MASHALPAPRKTRLADQSPIEQATLPIYRLLGAMAVVALALAALLGFAWDRHDLPVMLAVLATLIGTAWALRWRGLEALAALIEGCSLVLAASMATACLSVLFATSALPYQDALLIRIDSWLLPGFSWRDMFQALHRQDMLVALMSRIYASLLWQPFLLVALLTLTGRERDSWRFVRGWIIALAISVALFPLVPAVSPYPFYHIPHSDIPAMSVEIGWHQAEVLEPIRQGITRLLSPATMTGIISYPSFHAAGSVLLFWGFRRVPVLGVPFMIADVAMALTAPLIGSHYFIDVVAGVAVAVVAIRLAARGQ